MAAPKVSVIIPTMKGREHLLLRLCATIPSECETIIVDADWMLLAEKRNYGAARARGEYLLFIDDDNYLKPGAIDEMIYRFRPEMGVMGMTACYHNKKMRIADGGSFRSYISGFTWGERTNEKVYKYNWFATLRDRDMNWYEVDEVANAFMIPRQVFFEVGGFDQANFPIDLDEADICKRIKDMGYIVVMSPHAVCYHNSVTYSHVPDFRRPMNAYFMGRNRILFQKKHLSKLKLAVYFVVFFPVFVLSYSACLLYRRKPAMVWHFIKGVVDGILGRKKNQYQS